MGVLCRFLGIEIVMHFDDHAPPHFHARYGGHEAKIAIASGEVIRGRLSPRAARLVRQWTRRYKTELERNWTYGRRFGHLERIPPLE